MLQLQIQLAWLCLILASVHASSPISSGGSDVTQRMTSSHSSYDYPNALIDAYLAEGGSSVPGTPRQTFLARQIADIYSDYEQPWLAFDGGNDADDDASVNTTTDTISTEESEGADDFVAAILGRRPQPAQPPVDHRANANRRSLLPEAQSMLSMVTEVTEPETSSVASEAPTVTADSSFEDNDYSLVTTAGHASIAGAAGRRREAYIIPDARPVSLMRTPRQSMHQVSTSSASASAAEDDSNDYMSVATRPPPAFDILETREGEASVNPRRHSVTLKPRARVSRLIDDCDEERCGSPFADSALPREGALTPPSHTTTDEEFLPRHGGRRMPVSYFSDTSPEASLYEEEGVFTPGGRMDSASDLASLATSSSDADRTVRSSYDSDRPMSDLSFLSKAEIVEAQALEYHVPRLVDTVSGLTAARSRLPLAPFMSLSDSSDESTGVRTARNSIVAEPARTQPFAAERVPAVPDLVRQSLAPRIVTLTAMQQQPQTQRQQQPQTMDAATFAAQHTAPMAFLTSDPASSPDSPYGPTAASAPFSTRNLLRSRASINSLASAFRSRSRGATHRGSESTDSVNTAGLSSPSHSNDREKVLDEMLHHVRETVVRPGANALATQSAVSLHDLPAKHRMATPRRASAAAGASLQRQRYSGDFNSPLHHQQQQQQQQSGSGFTMPAVSSSSMLVPVREERSPVQTMYGLPSSAATTTTITSAHGGSDSARSRFMFFRKKSGSAAAGAASSASTSGTPSPASSSSTPRKGSGFRHLIPFAKPSSSSSAAAPLVIGEPTNVVHVTGHGGGSAMLESAMQFQRQQQQREEQQQQQQQAEAEEDASFYRAPRHVFGSEVNLGSRKGYTATRPQSGNFF